MNENGNISFFLLLAKNFHPSVSGYVCDQQGIFLFAILGDSHLALCIATISMFNWPAIFITDIANPMRIERTRE